MLSLHYSTLICYQIITVKLQCKRIIGTKNSFLFTPVVLLPRVLRAILLDEIVVPVLHLSGAAEDEDDIADDIDDGSHAEDHLPLRRVFLQETTTPSMKTKSLGGDLPRR